MPVIYPSSIPDPKRFLAPVGKYSVEVSEITEKQTTNGDEMWELIFSITAGEFAGKKLFTNLVFSEGGMGNIKVFCKSAGLDMTVDRMALRPENVSGAALGVRIVHKDFNGEPQAQVPYAGFFSLDTLPANPTPANPYATTKPAQRQPEQGQPSAGAQEFGSEDVPF